MTLKNRRTDERLLFPIDEIRSTCVRSAMERIKNAKNFFSKLRVSVLSVSLSPPLSVLVYLFGRTVDIDESQKQRTKERETDEREIEARKKGPSAYSSASRRAPLGTRTLHERFLLHERSFPG